MTVERKVDVDAFSADSIDEAIRQLDKLCEDLREGDDRVGGLLAKDGEDFAYSVVHVVSGQLQSTIQSVERGGRHFVEAGPAMDYDEEFDVEYDYAPIEEARGGDHGFMARTFGHLTNVNVYSGIAREGYR